MYIIPVIDLKDGLVVSAQQGNRNCYQPINSPLCCSSLISDILECFLAIYPFKTLYIADLNAISKTGNNQMLIDKVVSQFSAIEFWVDNGKKTQELTVKSQYKAVIGTESQKEVDFQIDKNSLNGSILSLDFFPDKGYVGPAELLNDPELWPQQIIIMTLDKVGKQSGPDVDRLRYFSRKYPNKNFIAAGGIRNESDLLNLKEIGISHTLIASALHSGSINAETIKNLQAKKMPQQC